MPAARVRIRKVVEGRSDPKPRRLENTLPGQNVRDADPDRHYIWANENSGGEFDVSYYLSLGEGLDVPQVEAYQVETHRPGGPRVAVGNIAKENDWIRFRGMVLMSCPKAFKTLVEQIGEFGVTGQAAADRSDQMAKKRKGSREDLSDIVGGGISLHTKRQLEGLPELNENEE